MTYLAKHCGWDKDFIAENFTLSQIKIYYEYLNQIEIQDTKRMAIAFRAAQTKDEDFQRFLDDGKGENVSNPNVLNEMRQDGLIEEQ